MAKTVDQKQKDNVAGREKQNGRHASSLLSSCFIMQQVVGPGGGATTPSPLTLSWLQSRVLTATKQCCVVNVKKRKVSTQQSRSGHVETLTHHTSSFCLLLHHYCLLLTLYLLLSLCLEVAAVIYLRRRLNVKQDVSGRFRPLRVDEVFV